MEIEEPRESFFQAIILVGKEDGRMFPLTEDIPKCLLPVGNNPILAYQLDLCYRSGLREVFLACPKEFERPIVNFLRDYRGMVRVEVVWYLDGGELEGLRMLADRIRRDAIVLGSDVISECVLNRLAMVHRLRAADCTMLLKEEIVDDVSDKTKKPKQRRDEEDRDIVGLFADGRVALKHSADMDENLAISKALLRRTGPICVRTDLFDVRVYVFSRWVLQFLKSNKNLSMLRTELVPFLVNRQFQSFEYLVEHLPGIELRERPLSSVDPSPTLDPLRVYCDILPSFQATSTSNPDSSREGMLCMRITTISDLLQADKEVVGLVPGPATPWAVPEGLSKRDTSVIGSNCDIGDKVLMKGCSVGSGCQIGARTKINNCILMANTHIGENCVLQNCVLANDVTVEASCNLNDCSIGPNARVPLASKLKGEVISRDG